jgi:hypothetical protein
MAIIIAAMSFFRERFGGSGGGGGALAVAISMRFLIFIPV